MKKIFNKAVYAAVVICILSFSGSYVLAMQPEQPSSVSNEQGFSVAVDVWSDISIRLRKGESRREQARRLFIKNKLDNKLKNQSYFQSLENLLED